METPQKNLGFGVLYFVYCFFWFWVPTIATYISKVYTLFPRSISKVGQLLPDDYYLLKNSSLPPKKKQKTVYIYIYIYIIVIIVRTIFLFLFGGGVGGVGGLLSKQ